MAKYYKGTAVCQRCGGIIRWGRAVLLPSWPKCPFCGEKLVVKITEAR